MPELYRQVSALPRGTSLARFIIAKALGHGDLYTELSIAEQWRDTPQVKASLELPHTKAAIPPGLVTDATWAGPLSIHGVAPEAITIERSRSIRGAVEAQTQKVPLRVKVARETGTGFSGAWVAAGAPIPVQKTDFATSIQEHYKFACIVPLSEELMQISNPDAQATITRTVIGGLAAALDNQFLLPTVAAVANVNPASVTNGSTEITTTGTTAAQIAADLAGMLAAVTTPGPLVWIMKPKTMYRISLTLGSQAAGLPNTLFGIPVVASTTSPAQITLLDPSAILYSDSGQFDLDVSTRATLELNTTPADPTTASTIFETLFGRNLVAIRALRWLTWLNPTPTTSAAFMTVAY